MAWWYRDRVLKRPKIGITTSLTVKLDPERSYLNSSYVRAIQQAGGVPIPLPSTLNRDSLRAIYQLVDGVLLTGGGDVDPKRFGELPHPTLFDVVSERDELEIKLVDWAASEKKPLLAICRGIQVLNVAFGGNLYQDVASDPGTKLSHNQEEPKDQPSHSVKITSGSFLADVLEREELEVNSLHHQAVKALGRGLLPNAHAPDGLIEGVELAERDPHHFLLGVQWHPEELTERAPEARRLFARFVEASRK